MEKAFRLFSSNPCFGGHVIGKLCVGQMRRAKSSMIGDLALNSGVGASLKPTTRNTTRHMSSVIVNPGDLPCGTRAGASAPSICTRVRSIESRLRLTQKTEGLLSPKAPNQTTHWSGGHRLSKKLVYHAAGTTPCESKKSLIRAVFKAHRAIRRCSPGESRKGGVPLTMMGARMGLISFSRSDIHSLLHFSQTRLAVIAMLGLRHPTGPFVCVKGPRSAPLPLSDKSFINHFGQTSSSDRGDRPHHTHLRGGVATFAFDLL
jgi:hypothetical protein